MNQFLDLVQETNKVLAAAWLLQLANGLGFDLPNSLSCYLENVANFFQCVTVPVAQAITKPVSYTHLTLPTIYSV